MSSLPQDIIVDILCRIPVKNLLRFRCVSKAWCRLIDGPDFINLHLSYSKRTQNFLILKHSKNLYRVSLDSLDSVSEVDQPLMCYNHCVKVLGSCNGLVCIRNIVDDVAFWNPSTRKHRVLPCLSLERRSCPGNPVCNVCVYGFGYDSVHDDYKLVRVAQFSSLESESRYFESEVKVFSLVRNKWRRIEDLNYVVRYPRTNGVFACGCLHWVVSRNVEVKVYDVVVALDLAVEDYREVELPEFGDSNFNVELGALGGCFCVVLNYHDVRSDVWLMEEYGVRDSWTKLFSISQDQVGRYFGTIRPLGYANMGKEVLFQIQCVKSNLVAYDVNTGSVKNVKIRGTPISFKVNICVESLVSFNVYDERRQIAGEEKTNEKKRDDFLSEGFKLVL